MCSRVGRIDKLSRYECIRDLLGQLFCLGNRTLHSFSSIRQYKLSTISLQNISSLYTHRLRHGQDNTISFCRCDRSQANTCITRSRFDNHRTLLQQSFLLCIFDQCLGHSVLHASGGIKILQFCKNLCLQSQLFFNINKLHQRSFSDQSECTLIYVCHNVCPPYSYFFDMFYLITWIIYLFSYFVNSFVKIVIRT